MKEIGFHSSGLTPSEAALFSVSLSPSRLLVVSMVALVSACPVAVLWDSFSDLISSSVDCTLFLLT